MTEGVVGWDGGWTWYRLVGDLRDSAHLPLVVIHGGPGSTHDYLEPLSALTEQTGRAVVFYDQLGSGRSQHLPDAPQDLWTPALFCRELDALLDHLAISARYHVLGQSWGGMLAMEHALRQPKGLRALIIANSPPSMALWNEEIVRLRGLLPEHTQATLTHHEAAGTTSSDEYQQAWMFFYQRYMCRITPLPEVVQRTFRLADEDPTVYNAMYGPDTFPVTGTLRDWDLTSRLPEITRPVLVISGEHDVASPTVVRPLVHGLADARWELVDGTSHSTHLEQPDRFLELVAAFLAPHDVQ